MNGTLGNIVLTAIFLLTVQQAFAGNAKQLPSDTDRLSYGIGVSIIRNLNQLGGEYNLDILIQGMRDEMLGNDLLLKEAELEALAETIMVEIERKKSITKVPRKTDAPMKDAPSSGKHGSVPVPAQGSADANAVTSSGTGSEARTPQPAAEIPQDVPHNPVVYPRSELKLEVEKMRDMLRSRDAFDKGLDLEPGAEQNPSEEPSQKSGPAPTTEK